MDVSFFPLSWVRGLSYKEFILPFFSLLPQFGLPLIAAVHGGRLDCVILLLEAKCDPSERQNGHFSALHAAVTSNRVNNGLRVHSETKLPIS